MVEPMTLPLQFSSVKLQVFRAPIAPVTEEQLWKLAASLAGTYTQVNKLPNGIQLSNPQLQRVLVYDVVQVNIQENSVRNVTEAVAQVNSTLEAVHQVVPLQPPFPVIAILEATMGAIGGTASERIMRILGPIGEKLQALGDNIIGPGIRFIYSKGVDSIDLRLEPLFRDVRNYFVTATFNRTQAPLPELAQLQNYLHGCLSAVENDINPVLQSILNLAP